jgi:hypothetical protein|tara:strand:- start:2747 stop:3316 length:570 start_codon:yes stop_codon:yes gene_type:complete
MTDYSISDDVWEQRVYNIRAWFDTNADAFSSTKEYEDRKFIVDILIKMGDAEPRFRKRYWTSIRNMFRGVANRPITGRPDIMNVEIKAGLNKYLENFRLECIHIFNTMHCFAAIACLPHPKSRSRLSSEGFRFDNAEAYADNAVKMKGFTLRSAYSAMYHNRPGKSLYWDGSFTEGPIPDIQGHPYEEE